AADKLNSVVILNGATIRGFTITGGTGKPAKSSYGFDYYGGGIHARGESVIERCIITGNGKGVARKSAGTFAGGVYAGSGSKITLRDSLLYDNYAWACGGALLVDHGANMKIENCTIFGNDSTNFFGHQGGVGMANGGKVQIGNSIIWGNSGDEIGAFASIYARGTQATVSHSLIEGGFTGTGNLKVSSPGFINQNNPKGLDGILGTVDDGLRLTSNSSVISKAINEPTEELSEIDICGFLRIQGEAMDMGCYEYGNELPKNKDNENTLKTGLIAYYPFDGDAFDYSGNEYHGKVVGASLSKDRFGVDGHAYAFDGVDDFIEVPHHQSLNQLPLSISLWFNSNGKQEQSGLVSKYSAATWNGWQIMEFDGNLVPWYLRSHSPRNVIIGKYGESKEFETPVEPKVWNHAVCTFDDVSGHIYMNKKLVDSKDWTGKAGSVSSSYPLTFGKYLGSSDGFFHGKIDDIRIYDRALSSDEVLELYELEKAPEHLGKPRPPVGPPTGTPEPLVDYIKLLREIMEEIAKVESELNDLSEQTVQKDAEIEKWESELVSINREINDARVQLADCLEECNRTREEMAQVQKETLTHNLTIVGLEGELRASAERLNSLRNDRDGMVKQITKIEKDMEEATAKLNTAHTPGWHYVPAYGWLWTSPEHYPLIYSNDREGWVYYERGTSDPWLYFDYNSEKWEKWFHDAPLFSSNN
ncbi:MAG: hypothetical protein HN553_07120, partial [Opitutae bacterium]|nr:hypothetical protein [Opitutae bacterium]